MKLFVYIVVFLLAKASFAQQSVLDTTWFDSDWKEVSKKYANYYRTSQKTDKGFLISDYYLDGHLQMVAEASQLSPLLKNGKCTYYNKNQTKSSSGTYRNGQQLGSWIYYYDNQTDSSVLTVAENGEKTYSRKSKLEDVFTVVEVMPEFPGGVQEMMKFIQTTIKYPREAEVKKWTGKTFVKFIVNESGNVVEPQIIKSSGYAILDNEAIRVIQLMPTWTPGMQNNKKVSVFFNIPFNFTLRK